MLSKIFILGIFPILLEGELLEFENKCHPIKLKYFRLELRKKVFVQIHLTNFQLTKDENFEESLLSFHVRILNNFWFHKSENND